MLRPICQRRLPGASSSFQIGLTRRALPLIYEHSREAGPDETFFLVGENLTTGVIAWGQSATSANGQEWRPRVLFQTGNYLAATLPENAPDGVFLVWVKNAKGYSAPIVLNRPEPWWCRVEPTEPVEQPAPPHIDVYGRNLARRPDFKRAFAYVRRPGKPGKWLGQAGAYGPRGGYFASFSLLTHLEAGDYELRLHAGTGGEWGWSEPVNFRIQAVRSGTPRETTLKPGVSGEDLQKAVDAAAASPEGAVVHLSAGVIDIRGTLVIPAHVYLQGLNPDETILQTVNDPKARFARLGGSGWNQAPGRIHTPGDTMTYRLEGSVPGTYSVWVRYGTDMKPWNQPGVSGNHTLAVDQEFAGSAHEPGEHRKLSGRGAMVEGRDAEAGRRKACSYLEEREGWRDLARRVASSP